LNLSSTLLVCASLLLVGSACVSAPIESIDAPPEYDPSPAYPHWAGRPATWTKLGDIERWLEGDGPRRYPEQVPQAELELAEGRLELARKEAGDLSAPVLSGRLDAAEAGFQRVLALRDAKATVRLRAEDGLEEIARLRGSALATAKPRAPTGLEKGALGTGFAIQPRTAWLASGPLPHRLTAASGWNRITIHHSAKDSKEIGTPTTGHVAGTIKDIQTVHMRDRGWGDIGYHFLIDPTGRVWQGRTLDWQGAHAQGNNNVANIGICLLGDFNHERPDARALTALEDLVDALCERHRIPRNRIYGHQKFAATECPGDALMAWVSRYAAGATH
jgi:hypothetical protein